jgi:hypothetical protein
MLVAIGAVFFMTETAYPFGRTLARAIRFRGEPKPLASSIYKPSPPPGEREG